MFQSPVVAPGNTQALSASLVRAAASQSEWLENVSCTFLLCLSELKIFSEIFKKIQINLVELIQNFEVLS